MELIKNITNEKIKEERIKKIEKTGEVIHIKEHNLKIPIDEINCIDDDNTESKMIELCFKYGIEDKAIAEKLINIYYKFIEKNKIENLLKEILCFNLVSFWMMNNKIIKKTQDNFPLVFINIEKIKELNKKEKKKVLNYFKEQLRLNVWKKNLIQKMYIEYENIVYKLNDVYEIKDYILNKTINDKEFEKIEYIDNFIQFEI